jgi:hypothetical protein
MNDKTVQRPKISYATQTEQGTKAWDIFMSPFGFATTRKLSISFFEYISDTIFDGCQGHRIFSIGNIPYERKYYLGEIFAESVWLVVDTRINLYPEVLMGYGTNTFNTWGITRKCAGV